MEVIYDMGSKMIDVMIKECVMVGDIIFIDKFFGKIIKFGCFYVCFCDYDVMGVDIKFF